jgi:hypothetical protein
MYPCREKFVKKHTELSLFSVLIAIVITSLLAACGSTAPGSTSSTTPPANPTSVATSNTTAPTVAASVPLKVTNVDMALSIPSIRGYKCGTSITETYTATFHFPANNAGGQVQFEYTTNNGRGNSQPTSLTVQAGQTSATYAFNWSGQLPADNTAPDRGGVMVTSPNAYTSDLVAPLRPCIPTPLAAFKVTSIDMAASPSIAGHACGTSFTENYTATFHIAPGSAGGTIVFQYTTNNGRSSSPNVSLPISTGGTTATYTFKWSGTLQTDHTAPGIGIVMVTAPNQLISPSAAPTGLCS